MNAKTVLLVEDTPCCTKVISKFLEHSKYQIELTAVAGGSSALLEASRTAFDVIILDIKLPDIDGFEVARQLRAIEAILGRSSTIVGISACPTKEYRDTALGVGMDEFLTKPLLMKHFIARIDHHLSKGILQLIKTLSTTKIPPFQEK